MKIFLCLFFIFPLLLIASPYNKIDINEKYYSEVQKLMFSHLSSSLVNEESEIQFLKDLVLLNKHLAYLDSSNANAFYFSEFYKSFYNFENNNRIKVKVSISKSNLLAAQEKLNQYKKIYSAFTIFFLEDILDNYSAFKDKKNILNNYKNQNQKDKLNPKSVAKISLLNKHVGLWIILFLKNTAKEFESILSEFIFNYYHSMAMTSHLFFHHSSPGTPVIIYSSKDQSFEKMLYNLTKTQVQTEPLNAPSSSARDVENIEVEPSEAAGDKIDQLIKKIDKTP